MISKQRISFEMLIFSDSWTEDAFYNMISKCGYLRRYEQKTFTQNDFKKRRRYVDIFGYWAKNDF